MMTISLLHGLTSQWLVLGVLCVLLALAAEAGFRLGFRLHEKGDEARKGQIGGVQGAILGLLGLLLGFTFSMSASRYEARRALVLQESNCIGTTYLRAALLPENRQPAVESLLRRYVDARIDFYEAGEDLVRQREVERVTSGLQGELWTHAVGAAKEAPTPVTVSFIDSLNDTIDTDAARVNALRTHVPGGVWLLVLMVSLCGCCVNGYSAGSSGRRNGFASWVLPLMVALAITFIADLDRPRGGMIGISQQPMLDLRESLRPRAP